MNAGLSLLLHILVNGGAVDWRATPPKISVPPALRAIVAKDPARHDLAITETLRRAGLFRGQLAATTGTPVIPLLVLPVAPPPPGHCISCGADLPAGCAWRCLACLVAVYIALDAVDALAARLEPA